MAPFDFSMASFGFPVISGGFSIDVCGFSMACVSSPLVSIDVQMGSMSCSITNQ